MRRRAEPQRAEQMPELGLLIFRSDAERFEHFLLQLRLVNPETPAADLDTVQYDVVRLGANIREFLCFKQRQVLSFRSGKGMMHRVPFVFLGTPFKEWKICHPKKIPFRRARRSRPTLQILYFSNTQPQPAKHFASDFPLICGEENAIAFFDIEFRSQRPLFGLREEFHDGRFPLAVLDFDKGESFRAVQFCDLS